MQEAERASREKILNLEGEVRALKNDIVVREQEIKRLRIENAQLSSADGQQAFSASERDILKERVRELIAKINSYL
ncbi:MAG TPA: hypothetical protein VMW43_12660 [Bacteroidota bacterium]|nr:hypothetical protein [Bacteroidota bacterium]